MKNIVLSFGVNTKNFSIWANGLNQSIFFLFLLLESIDEYNVHIVNFGIPINELKSDITFDINDINFTDWDDIKDDIDLFINTGDIDISILEYLKSKNTKTIKYISDNEYLNDANKILNSENKFTFFQYDRVWIHQHQIRMNKYYLESIYNCCVDIVPFIWNPIFIDSYIPKLQENGIEFGYKHKETAKNITIFESNKNITKTSLLSILIVEKLYKQQPESINKVRVLNSTNLRKNSYFMSVVNNLTIVKDAKIQFDDRYNTPYMLSKHTDVVLSHQIDSDLNYLYFDVLYGKYPLIHNSYMIKQCGYYYDGFDIESACYSLKQALCGNIKGKNIELLIKGVDVYNDDNKQKYLEKITILI